MDPVITQQVLTITLWLSLIALTLSIVAGALAWSTRKSLLANKEKDERPRAQSQILSDLEHKADQAIKERLDTHFQFALTQPDSPAMLANAILNHPQFLERLISSVTDKLSDGEDELTQELTQKMMTSTEGLLSQPETQEKLRTAVSKQLIGEVSDLLSEDDDIRATMLETFQKILPELIKELMSSNEEFKKKMGEVLIARVEGIFEDI